MPKELYKTSVSRIKHICVYLVEWSVVALKELFDILGNMLINATHEAPASTYLVLA